MPDPRRHLMNEVKSHVRVILALPWSPNDRPAKVRSGWPKYVREYVLSYNNDQARDALAANTRIVPTPVQIDEAMAFSWWSLTELDEMERYTLWAMAMRVPAALIGVRWHTSASTAWRWRNRALDRYDNSRPSKRPISTQHRIIHSPLIGAAVSARLPVDP